MESNIFESIMWWAVGLAAGTIILFLALGLLKGYFREKEAVNRRHKKQSPQKYSV